MNKSKENIKIIDKNDKSFSKIINFYKKSYKNEIIQNNVEGYIEKKTLKKIIFSARDNLPFEKTNLRNLSLNCMDKEKVRKIGKFNLPYIYNSLFDDDYLKGIFAINNTKFKLIMNSQLQRNRYDRNKILFG